MKYRFLLPFYLFCSSLGAEVVTDGTMGARVGLSGPDFKISADLGQQYGGNLFHSFQSFNLQSHESATFSGSGNVQTIISRVTGGNPSSIEGMIRSTIPNADVYFLNPYGIVFGENAKLDISGNFHASTADYLRLQEGGRFDARTPSNSLLTIAPIEAFGFMSDSPGALSFIKSSLSVPIGKTLSFIGGQLNFNQSKLSVAFGRINLASVAQSGAVILTSDELKVPGRGGDLQLSNRSEIDLSGEGGGNLFIRSGRLVMTNSSIKAESIGNSPGGKLDIQSDQVILTDGGTINTNSKAQGKGSDIQIKANEIRLKGANASGTKSSILVGTMNKDQGAGTSGDIRLEAQKITVSDGASISVDTLGAGNGGQLTFIADTLIVDGFLSEELARLGKYRDINSKISVGVPGSGKGGSLLVDARQISLKNGGVIISPIVNRGDGGTVTLRAKNIELSGVDRLGFESAIRAVNIYSSSGKGSNVYIETENLLLDNGGAIMGFNHGKGAGSHITIRATGTVILKGTSGQGRSSTIDVSSIIKLPPNEKVETPLVAGPAGSISLEAEKLVVQDGGRISSSSIAPREFGSSQGGEIVIKARSIELIGVNPHGENEDGFGSGIYARTIGKKAGNGGKIMLTTDTLLVKDGGLIQSSTNNTFKSGDIHIQVNGKATVIGDSTPIQLQSPLMSQKEYLQQFSPTTYNYIASGIYASSDNPGENSGEGGSIRLQAHQLALKDHAQISSHSDGGGQAGHIEFNIADFLNLSHQSMITTAAAKAGGGSITLNVAKLLYTHHSQVTTSVHDSTGNGGDLLIERPNFMVSDTSKITAQAYEGQGGNIHIVADQFIASPDTFISASSQKGISGKVMVDSPENNISGMLTFLPDTFMDATNLLVRCGDSFKKESSRFLIRRLRGRTPGPEDWQSGYN